jgi:uncharacterized membrane protein
MEKKMSTSTTKTKDMVTTAMFVAIILAMSFVPYLGYIPLGFMNATIIHIPVIIGAILLGPARGAFLGGIFGLTSMINNTFNPNLTSFVFSPFYSLGNVHGNFKSLMICFVPRILIGVVAYYVYTGIVKLVKKKKNDGKGSAAALAASRCGRSTYEYTARYEWHLLFVWKQLCQCKGNCHRCPVWCDSWCDWNTGRTGSDCGGGADCGNRKSTASYQTVIEMLIF